MKIPSAPKVPSLPKGPSIPTSADAILGRASRKYRKRALKELKSLRPGGSAGSRTSEKRRIIVYADAPYASMVEHGTPRENARPFLRPAARRATRGFGKELRSRLGKWN